MKPKKTILCVDDNEQSLSIRKVLLETRGYRVVACNNGEDAIERFRAGGIDLVLSDLIMPGVDGSRVVEQIKAISRRPPFFSRGKFASTIVTPTPMCSCPKVCMRQPNCWNAYDCCWCESEALDGYSEESPLELRPLASRERPVELILCDIVL